jgi:hypothetical protein
MPEPLELIARARLALAQAQAAAAAEAGKAGPGPLAPPPVATAAPPPAATPGKAEDRAAPRANGGSGRGFGGAALPVARLNSEADALAEMRQRVPLVALFKHHTLEVVLFALVGLYAQASVCERPWARGWFRCRLPAQGCKVSSHRAAPACVRLGVPCARSDSCPRPPACFPDTITTWLPKTLRDLGARNLTTQVWRPGARLFTGQRWAGNSAPAPLSVLPAVLGSRAHPRCVSC